MRAVRTDEHAYRVAVAELPRRAVLGDGPDAVRIAGGVLEAEGVTVVARPWLRADVVADAAQAPARSVLVECGAASGEVEELLRDAVGWARELAGGPLDIVECRATARGILARLEGARSGATVLLARREGGSSWLRALALDTTRTEVVIEHPGALATVERTDADGVHRSPARYESAERLALRRLLDALDDDVRTTDLDDLEHDSRLAAHVLGLVRAG